MSGQNSPALLPEQWCRFCAPSYPRLFSVGKKHGLKIWFHGCGTFVDVLPGLVDSGMDVWEPWQMHLPRNEPAYLKREFGRHISFSGGINTRHTLRFGTPEDVRREVTECIAVLGRGRGHTCGPDHSVMPGVPVENVLALVDEAYRCRDT